jgi:hypothetical protein
VHGVQLRLRLAPGGRIRDLGLGGALVEVDREYRPDEILSGRLEAPGREPVAVLCRVVRCTRAPGGAEWTAAVAFELVGEALRRELGDLIGAVQVGAATSPATVARAS